MGRPIADRACQRVELAPENRAELVSLLQDLVEGARRLYVAAVGQAPSHLAQRAVVSDAVVAGGNDRHRNRDPGQSRAPLQLVHRCTAGIPRLINLLCDRSLLGAYSERAPRVTPDMVRRAAATLDLPVPRASWVGWMRTQAARLF